MSDVFVSYARSTEPQAKAIAAALRDEGYEVWRDDQIPSHKAYAEVIEERLRSAKAVVVIWSADAAKSQWVRAEADTARELGTLIQVRVDKTLPPLPFNQIQCSEIDCSDDQVTGPGWEKLKASVSALAGTGHGARREPCSVPTQEKVAICVLPFTNMSGDAEQEYFSDGISEDITTDLSQVSALEVTARNTAFTFKGRSVDICEVARKLGVTHVLEGSVRKVGNRVRINAQLIDGASGAHLWAERFDRDLTDIFEIQDEIGKSIVGALRVRLLPEEKKALEQRGTNNVEAYKLYLLARQYWQTGNHGDQRREERVMRICKRAVEIDPYYAQAWALLAIAQSNLHYNFGSAVDDGFAAAHAALSIDPNVGEAYCAKVRRFAERGQDAQAQVELDKALRAAPDSWDVHKEAGRLARRRRDGAERARTHYRRAVELMDNDFHAWAMLVTCCKALGDEECVQSGARKMVSEAERALEHDPSNGSALGIVAGGHAILGEADRAREWINRALLIDPDNLMMRYNFACVLAGYVGDVDWSLRLLEGVLRSGGKRFLTAAEVDSDLDSLRDNPRFEKMLAAARDRVGETPQSPASPAAT
ncbi:MAG TPA: TIR domain-containing protein [Sphingomicrobium sp.]|nr:TIR domain-containing protein [Sphingomicrobium sp.]